MANDVGSEVTLHPLTPESIKRYLRRLKRKAGLIGFLCAVIRPNDSEYDRYRIHWHVWGWLRPHKRQVLLESVDLNRFAVITESHVVALLMYQPQTFVEAMVVLRNRFPNYNFQFLNGRHDS